MKKERWQKYKETLSPATQRRAGLIESAFDEVVKSGGEVGKEDIEEVLYQNMDYEELYPILEYLVDKYRKVKTKDEENKSDDNVRKYQRYYPKE